MKNKKITILILIFILNNHSCNMKEIKYINFTIQPYIGIEPLLFNMNKQQVKNIFLSNTIKEHHGTKNIQYVDEYGLHIAYDDKDLFDGLQFHYKMVEFRNASLFFEGKDLCTLKSKELIAYLREKDPDIKLINYIEFAGFVSEKYGFSIIIYYNFEEYGDDTTEFNEYWDAITIFRRRGSKELL